MVRLQAAALTPAMRADVTASDAERAAAMFQPQPQRRRQY